jgi:hypothetical protein
VSNNVANDAVSDEIIEGCHERVNGALCFDQGQEDHELLAETEGMRVSGSARHAEQSKGAT